MAHVDYLRDTFLKSHGSLCLELKQCTEEECSFWILSEWEINFHTHELLVCFLFTAAYTFWRLYNYFKKSWIWKIPRVILLFQGIGCEAVFWLFWNIFCCILRILGLYKKVFGSDFHRWHGVVRKILFLFSLEIRVIIRNLFWSLMV